MTSDNKSSSVLKWIKNFLAGGVAGAVSRTLTAPLERLKILYQVNYKGSNPPNIIKGLSEIVQKDGVRGLFRGNFVNVCKATPDTSIKFAVFELFKQLMRGDDETQTLQSYQLFLAGAGSGLISGFCVFPLDVLKTRFAAAPTGTYSSIVDAVRKITKAEGRIKPFFNGFQATLLAALPNSGINLMTYEFFKASANTYFGKQNKEVPMSLFMVIGAMSAVIASSLMYPFQLVTSRIIMQGMSQERLGMIGIIKQVRQHEGAWGFYKGFKPAMSKILFGNGIAYGSYEVCRKYFGISKK
jgi:solute carrier family 25 phosphate transporter 23/24/25/41